MNAMTRVLYRSALALVAASALAACAPEDSLTEPTPAETQVPAPVEEVTVETPEQGVAEVDRIVSAQNLPANHYILFVRGLDPKFNSSAYYAGSHTPEGCNTYWASAIQFFTNKGWGSRIRTVGIYSKQPAGSCYVNLENVVPNAATSLSGFKGSNPLTNDTQIGALGHRLAWWIYNNYTSKGYTVSIVGHSMGGLVARAAIGGSVKGYSGFPPALRVKGLVLLATPNNGASTAWLGGVTGCGTQCVEMRGGSVLLNTLNNSLDNGNSGVLHRLNLIGSNDYVVGDVRSGAYGGTGKAAYYISPAYDHNNIHKDMGTDTTAAVGWWDDRTQAYTLNPPKYQGQPKSLELTYRWAIAQ